MGGQEGGWTEAEVELMGAPGPVSTNDSQVFPKANNR